MHINFITVTQKGMQYDVVGKSCAIRESNSIIANLSQRILFSYLQESDAIVAAKAIAKKNKAHYIPANTSIITIAPFLRNYFVPIECTALNEVIHLGKSSTNFNEARAIATQIAEARGLPLIFPY